MSGEVHNEGIAQEGSNSKTVLGTPGMRRSPESFGSLGKRGSAGRSRRGSYCLSPEDLQKVQLFQSPGRDHSILLGRCDVFVKMYVYLFPLLLSRYR